MTLCEREIFDGSKKLSTMYLDIPSKIFKYNSYRAKESTIRDNLVYLAESIVNGLSHTYINNMFQYCASKLVKKGYTVIDSFNFIITELNNILGIK